jgi:hypothetical protein
MNKENEMPLKLSVGVTRKVGLPHYGSAGASCYLETDVDGSLIFADLSVFQDQVQQAFEACRRAVTDELANHRGADRCECAGFADNGVEENGHASDEPSPATDRQIGYARDLACQVPGLGTEQLDSVAAKMFGKPTAELTALEASGLIDTLKEIKLGNPRVQDALNGEVV